MWTGFVLSLFWIGAGTAAAQGGGDQPISNDQLKQLVDRLTAAEEKIKQLEDQLANKNGNGNNPNVEVTPSAPPPWARRLAAPTHRRCAAKSATDRAGSRTGARPAEETHDHMMSIPGGPELQIRGFFDVDFDEGSVAQQLQYPLGVPAHPSFRSGEFDLFMTSQLSDKLSFLSEMVVATDPSNEFGLRSRTLSIDLSPIEIF